MDMLLRCIGLPSKLRGVSAPDSVRSNFGAGESRLSTKWLLLLGMGMGLVGPAWARLSSVVGVMGLFNLGNGIDGILLLDHSNVMNT
jgi:hypothetical protein